MVPVWALVCTSVCNGVRCFYLSQQRMESTHIFRDYFFNRFLSTLVYVEVVYVCLQIETIVGFLHLRFFCLHLLLLIFFASVLIPQSLLTVCYWSGSWSWNWSMCSVTCLRYPTWAISLNNVFINWLIITVKLISRIYICVLPTIDL